MNLTNAAEQKDLLELYRAHDGKVSDKWFSYLSFYGELFKNFRCKPVRILEIGIQNGGSLEIWERFFPNHELIVGVDINPRCVELTYSNPRISIVVGDANTDEIHSQIIKLSNTYDIIIDDGSHRSSDIIKSFARYYSTLSMGGVYVAEDLHCSYMGAFEGGIEAPFSSMAFFKRIADMVNLEHWGVPCKAADMLSYFSRTCFTDFDEASIGLIEEVRFRNSICAVLKGHIGANQLGARVVVGSSAMVEDNTQYDDTYHSSTDETANVFGPSSQRLEVTVSTREMVEMALTERDRQIVERDRQIVERDSQIATLHKVIESAKAWQKRSWAKRAFHKWRAPGEERKKINFLKRIERSVRKRRDQLLNRSSRTPNKEKDSGPEKSGLTFIRSLAFHHSGKPRGWVRFLLFHKNKKPRRFFIRVSCKKSGRPRKLFSSWMNVASSSSIRNGRTYDEWIKQFDELTISDRRAIASNIVNMKEPPIISVVMPTHNTKFEWLREAIDSVRNQIYPHWQLCIADDASTAPHVRDILEHYRALDARIQIVYRSEGGHISAASNSALSLATGDFVALLDHDDVLSEHALYHVAAALQKNPDAKLIYSDEDKIDEDGIRHDPYFKPDWNLSLFRSHNLITHLGVYQKNLLLQIGGFREGFEGAQDYDLALRFIEHLNPDQIVHIPKILYHWRVHPESTASSSEAKPYAMLNGEKALNDHLSRSKTLGRATLIGHGFRVKYAIPKPNPQVSLIIATRDCYDLLRQLVLSIINKTKYDNYEIIIVDNGSSEPKALEFLKDITLNSQVRVVRDDDDFNFSRLNNFGVANSKGEIVVLMNNDMEVIDEDWLTEMVSIAIQPGIGAVGAKLLYPDSRVQHGGVILGIGGWAGHSHKGFKNNCHGYCGRLSLVSEFSAVTGACLAVKKDLYIELGGLDEKNLAVACNDVDFCLRLRERGLRNVWTPFAELFHHESVSRGYEDSPEKIARFALERAFMNKRWGRQLLVDPAYNPNLTLEAEDFSLAWPPRNNY